MWTCFLCSILFVISSAAAINEGIFEFEDIMDNSNTCHQTELCKTFKTLQQRTNSLEQPVWKITDENFRWAACNDGPCRCTVPSFAVNCYRLSLDSIPEGQSIPKDTLTLDIGSNKIHALHRNVFKKLNRLIQLDFSNNGLEYLPEHIFNGLESLKHLLLQRNRLEMLHDNIFKKLNNLVTLDLSENLLSNIHAIQWDGLNSLLSLQLMTNRIASWETSTDSLPKLEYLDLSVNRITHLKKLNLKTLLTLKLNSNGLTSIESEALQNLRKLQNLNLHQNKLEDLSPSLFHGLHNLTFLDLSNNMLPDISEEHWKDLKVLKELNLQRNLLEELRNNTFVHLTSLERLILTGNNIEIVQSAAFEGLHALVSLLLTNNIIQKFGRLTFEPLIHLNRLDLDSNNLMYVEEDSLEKLTNLKTIRLGKNAWLCDCRILYLANWIRDHSPVVFDYQPKCRGPGQLSGKLLYSMTFVEVCDGQWKSMQGFPARI